MVRGFGGGKNGRSLAVGGFDSISRGSSLGDWSTIRVGIVAGCVSRVRRRDIGEERVLGREMKGISKVYLEKSDRV